MNMNGYRCMACSATQEADFDGFLCPACGGNLDITYDYAAAVHEMGGRFPEGSRDLFRFAALLPLQQPRSPFPLRVGGTPLYPAPRLGELAGMRKLYLKDDTLNPSASLKDLACLAAATGLSAVVFVPASAPAAKLTQMLAVGAQVLTVQGNYDDAYDLCLAAADEFGWFNRSTGYNPFTREGKKTCAYEIWQDLDGRAPDRVVVSTGDGNTLSAVWKGWCDLQAVGLIDRLPKIDCAQSEASAAISETVHRIRAGGNPTVDWSTVVVREVKASTVADSISVDRPRDGLAAVKAIIQSGGEAVTVPDQEILAAIPEMARAAGVFPEPAAAAPWAAVKQMVREERIATDELVVCIVSGSGLKDITNTRTVAGEPQLIEPSLKAVRDAVKA
jgi:threonine synthase